MEVPAKISCLLKILVPIACILLLPAMSRAQLLQGTINGNVSDPSGAMVAGARVVAVDEATHFERAAVTTSTGAYTLPDLPPGTYTVTASAPGLQAYRLTGVAVTVQTVTRVDIRMAVGEVNESVTVAANAAVLQTDRADVHSELGEQDLNNLPVPIGRNYQMLFSTVPGVSPPQNGHSFGANSRALFLSPSMAATSMRTISVWTARAPETSARPMSASTFPRWKRFRR